MQTYRDEERFGADYRAVRDFLLELGEGPYEFGRWDWMITHGYLQREALERIGIWREEGRIVGIATYDTVLGKGYCPVRPGYDRIKGEMLLYAERNFRQDGKCSVLIPDGDRAFARIAAELGFVATDERDSDAVFYIDQTPTDYRLPDGFSIVSMAQDYDPVKYAQVLYKGFNHEQGEGPFAFNEADRPDYMASMIRPNVNRDIKIAVVAPDGQYVSYCGMWYDRRATHALVEPVATDPAYRRMGLGKAAVLEGIRRCAALGAKVAFVGSTQAFYYRIGFRPYATATYWTKK